VTALDANVNKEKITQQNSATINFGEIVRTRSKQLEYKHVNGVVDVSIILQIIFQLSKSISILVALDY